MSKSQGAQEALSELGGVATWVELTERCGAQRVQCAVAVDHITKGREDVTSLSRPERTWPKRTP